MMSTKREKSGSPKDLNVPREAAEAYLAAGEAMVADVDRAIFAHPRREMLLGTVPEEVLRNNHRNHHRFLSTVLWLDDVALLRETLPWVYRAYLGQTLSPEYFPVVLEAWMEAVQTHVDAPHAGPILQVYRWMRQRHDTLLQLASRSPDAPAPDPRWEPLVDRLLTCLLDSNLPGCRQVARQVVAEQGDLQDLYLEVIQPALYELGRRWERGEVSVAQEHLATAMVGRLMAQIYALVPVPKQHRGRVVVTAAANEYHDLGARMVADLLERDGWDAHYLGANTPVGELVRQLAQHTPQALLVSVCVPFNLRAAAQLINVVRSTPGLEKLRILVGGQAFGLSEDLWARVGADAMAADASAAVAQLQRWFPGSAAERARRGSSGPGVRGGAAEPSGARPATHFAGSFGGPSDALFGLARIQNELLNSQRALQKRLKELEAANERIRVLSGLIPICGHCKKIRDDSGFWSQLEVYLSEHSEASFSHSICPSCMEEHYGALLDDIQVTDDSGGSDQTGGSDVA